MASPQEAQAFAKLLIDPRVGKSEESLAGLAKAFGHAPVAVLAYLAQKQAIFCPIPSKKGYADFLSDHEEIQIMKLKLDIHIGTLAANDVPALRERLRRVFWLGGGSGAGKSTIARRLADKHGLRLYSTDDTMSDHAARCSAEESPYLTTFKTMTMDERWVHRSPQTMLETFHWFRGEGFGLIINDLLKLPSHEGILVEGFRLLPSLVKPLLHDPNHAVWLIPTPEFRHAAFESRGTLWSIAAKTSRPERALENLLERDRLFTEQLEGMAQAEGVPVIRVDCSMTESILEDLVAVQYGLRRAPFFPPAFDF